MVCNLNEHAACLIIDIKGILKITLLLDIPESFFHEQERKWFFNVTKQKKRVVIKIIRNYFERSALEFIVCLFMII